MTNLHQMPDYTQIERLAREERANATRDLWFAFREWMRAARVRSEG